MFFADTPVLIDGHKIAQKRAGDGPPVVLIHGTPAFSYLWRNVAPALVEAGHEVLVYDLLGYGRSERPHDPATDTSVSAQVPLLLKLLDHWGLQKVHLVGTDIGGAIAMHLGIFHPERLLSLTVTDTVSFDSWPSARTRQQIAGGLDRLLATPDAAHRAHFAEWLRSAVHHQDRFEADALSAYLDQIAGPVGQASLVQHQIRHYDPVHTQMLTPRLADLGRLPVQILWGANDAWQVVDWAHRLHAEIPGSRLTVLPACGHFAMEDQPERIAAEILDFIAGKAT